MLLILLLLIINEPIELNELVILLFAYIEDGFAGSIFILPLTTFLFLTFKLFFLLLFNFGFIIDTPAFSNVDAGTLFILFCLILSNGFFILS